MLRKLTHFILAHIIASYVSYFAEFATIAMVVKHVDDVHVIRLLVAFLIAPILSPLMLVASVYEWHRGLLSWDWDHGIGKVLLAANLAYLLVLVPTWYALSRRLPLADRRRLAGQCPICGYDLRATPDRCPECGAMPAKK